VLTLSRAGSDQLRVGAASGGSTEATTRVMSTANNERTVTSDGVSKWYYI